MTAINQHLEEQFKTLFPYVPLTGPEYAAYLIATENWLTERLRELPENTCCKCAYEELDGLLAEIKAAQRRVSPRTERHTVVLRVPSDTRRRLTQ